MFQSVVWIQPYHAPEDSPAVFYWICTTAHSKLNFESAVTWGDSIPVGRAAVSDSYTGLFATWLTMFTLMM
jgi:hypothetical protein